MKRQSQIVSIFGQIEEIVAEQMIAERRGVNKLAPTDAVSLDDIPESTQHNEQGEKVRLVIVLPSKLMREFERRIKELRQ